MKAEDIVIFTFDIQKMMKTTKVPVICVYNSPSDYPNKYVARLWDLNKPTNIVTVADSLDEIRETKPPEMMILQRQANDDPVIAETWV